MAQILRAEARPAQWEDLYSTQQEAVRLIGQMICEAIDRVDASAKAAPSVTADGVSDWLQKNRASQLAFLVAGRGTGKTTVLATLAELARSASTPAGDVLPADVKDDLVNIGKRVVWLEPMDMEVVSSTTNMIAAVLVRIDAACARAPRCPVRRGETRGLLDPQGDDEPLIDLQKLQNKIALGWSGYSSAELSRTDPDTAAIEMLRQERTRLALNADLDRVLSKLASTAFRNQPSDNPLFLLPVDDFDLNPPSVLQLLRVLRMISVPRLFFLILGDLEVAEVVLNLKLSNDLADVADGVEKEMLSIMPGEIALLAGTISANAARKLIPPAQRVNLTPLSLIEAINFRPLGHQEKDDALFELMAKLPVELNPANRSDPSLWQADNL